MGAPRRVEAAEGLRRARVVLGGFDAEAQAERFEARWNRSNRIRTAIAVVTMVLLLLVLIRLSAA